MSMTSAALAMARNAASTTASSVPIRVTTVRLVASPGSTSSSLAPSTVSICEVMASMTSRSRPSLKLGTHSMSFIFYDSFTSAPRAPRGPAKPRF
jgi:hypothetical protein